MADPELDNPGWSSLTGPHARFAERRGRAARYPADMSPWHALDDPATPPPGPGEPDPEAVVLGPADVPAMRELVRRTDPGPFEERTVEMGTYLGLRAGGQLMAMAGNGCGRPGTPRSARSAPRRVSHTAATRSDSYLTQEAPGTKP